MISPETTSGGERIGSLRDWLVAWAFLAALAAALSLPALLSPAMTYASFWIDHVWIDQFADQLARGIFYPRWLPQSHDGLGAPVFHYYAPLTFYLGAGFKLMGLTAYGAVLATFAFAWFASGVAMLHCVGDPKRRGLIAAGLYMALPYHVLDFYRRGALAEFCVYPLIPLLVVALRRAGDGRGFALLAFTYAALLMTHLPMALLTSLFLIVPYAARMLAVRRRGARPIAAGLALGLALAATYIVPALTLQHAVLIGKLWSVGELQPGNWSFFVPDRWPDRPSVLLFIALTAALAVAAVPAALARGRWAYWALGLCAVVAGAVPGLWSLPMLAKVQFPWRALLLVEFGAAVAIARSRVRPSYLAMATVPAMVLAVALLRPAGGSGLTIDNLRRHPDVLEYLPAGFPTPESGGTFSQRALDLSKRPPLVRRDDGATVARRFYNPAWAVTCDGRAVETFPDPATRLLAWRGERCAVRWRPPRAEWIGGAISLAALLALGLLYCRRRLAAPAAASARPAAPRPRSPPLDRSYAGTTG